MIGTPCAKLALNGGVEEIDLPHPSGYWESVTGIKSLQMTFALKTFVRLQAATAVIVAAMKCNG
jgi:hypothetical protein